MRDCRRLSSSLLSANQTEKWEVKGLVRQVTSASGSRLTLVKPGLEASGWYRCSVIGENPQLWYVYGNETEVDIVEAPPPSLLHVEGLGLPWWVWVIVGSGSVVLAVITVGIWILCRRDRVQMAEHPISGNINPRCKRSVTCNRSLLVPGPTPQINHAMPSHKAMLQAPKDPPETSNLQPQEESIYANQYM
ncbi:hypothetical protein SKAU_G00117590 [Synaphobranchus kaupii]|uniref:Ig-like domain-containing protein n=1 Tax=Synaphobranchus kaupii TaxID=118154 RepID=A0A9Q1J228_SYNKA|nr:hypothetical protein SKAU_G00117590 [Synaphobranchus kaupii]